MLNQKIYLTVIICVFCGNLSSMMLQARELSKEQTIKKHTNKLEFQALPYSYDALEPYIDKLTVETHFSEHQKLYYKNYIKSIKTAGLEALDITEIFKNISKYPVNVRNNVGGYFNHSLYWENMKPQGGILPAGTLSDAINGTFGSLEEFKKIFSECGKNLNGDGWIWLCLNDLGNMFICSTPNQDNPLMDVSEKMGVPLLAMDVWEHAYNLKYQNNKAEYIDAFLYVVNWEVVAGRYDAAFKSLALTK